MEIKSRMSWDGDSILSESCFWNWPKSQVYDYVGCGIPGLGSRGF